MLACRARLLTMAGPSESVLMAKVRSQHLKMIFSRLRSKIQEAAKAHIEYVLPKEWKVVCSYKSCCHAQLDTEDIDFDIYKRACEFMELSGMKMLPQQEAQRQCAPLAT